MIRIFLFLFLFFGKTLNAGILSGCGGLSSPNNFSDYSCPKIDGEESTLEQIDFSNGYIQCHYGKTGATTRPAFKTNCKEKSNAEIESIRVQKKDAALAGAISSKISKFENRFNRYGLKLNSTLFLDALNTTKRNKEIDEVKNKAKSNKQPWEDTIATALNANPIDSHTNYRGSLSAIMAGVFTMDPSYFIEGYVDAAGRLTLRKDFKSSAIVPKTDNGFWSGVLDSMGFDTDYSNAKIIYESPLDFIDRQVLGYIFDIAEALRKTYNEIILIIFLFAAVFSGGYYAFNKFMERQSKTPFDINKSQFVITAIMSFLFFAAPISDDKKVNSRTEGVPTTETTSGYQVENASTLAQETLRYSISMGTYYANKSSDYLMQAYLTFIGRKEGFLNLSENKLNALKSSVDSINREKYMLNSKLNFYENVCQPYYWKDNISIFNSSQYKRQGYYNTTLNTPKLDAVGITADRLSYTYCASLEQEIMKDVDSIVLASAEVKDRVGLYLAIHNTDKKSQKAITTLVKMMATGQSSLGWMFVPIVPVSYYFFSQSNVFLYDVVSTKEERREVWSNKIKNISRIEREKLDLDTSWSEGLEDVAVELMSTSVMQSGYYFLVPGFGDLFKHLDTTFNKIYMSDIDLYNAERGDKNLGEAGIVSKVLNKAKSVVLAVGGGPLAIVFDKLTSLTKSTIDAFGAKKKWVSVALTIAAFVISIYMITFIISTVTIMVISGLLTLKIVLFFIKLLVIFMVIPLLGIHSAIMQKNGGKNGFGEFALQNVTIFSTPIIIVLIASLIIPASVVFEELFSMIIYTLHAVLQEGESLLAIASSNSNGTAEAGGGLAASIQKIFVLSSLEGMVTMFSAFSTLIAGVIMLYSFEGLIEKLVGITSSGDTFKEASSELRQGGAGKVMNPIG